MAPAETLASELKDTEKAKEKEKENGKANGHKRTGSRTIDSNDSQELSTSSTANGKRKRPAMVSFSALFRYSDALVSKIVLNCI